MSHMDPSQLALVTTTMRDFTRPFVLPLSYEPDEATVKLAGTGNVIEFTCRLLLTCQHVIFDNDQGQYRRELALRFFGTEDVYRTPQKFVGGSYPQDIAIARISDELWSASPHQSAPIVSELFAPQHTPVKDELLFFKGFADENSVFAFETLSSGATSYLTREIPGQTDDDFFMLYHKPEETFILDSPAKFLSPQGFSGALVWDTKYKSCEENDIVWSPELARVTGLVCRWSTGDPGITVLRVEHVLSFISAGLPCLP